jgi:hypothetical protein
MNYAQEVANVLGWPLTPYQEAQVNALFAACAEKAVMGYKGLHPEMDAAPSGNSELSRRVSDLEAKMRRLESLVSGVAPMGDWPREPGA